MIFSSLTFLFAYLPLTLAVYFLAPLRWRNLVLLLVSLFFYGWGEPVYIVIMFASILIDYIHGLLVEKYRADDKKARWFVGQSVVFNLLLLGFFKYWDFLAANLSLIPGVHIPQLGIPLPIGISFFTFQTISYVIDVYRGRIGPLRRWIDYVFYVSFFPQLVAGPIVRARDFIPQIYKTPVVTRAEFGEGLFLVLCGLFKKTVISDYISLNFVDRIFDAPLLYTGVENLLGVYGYALQIYCDFSGYSDMAIGIALLLGFRFNVNFDSPYQSATITEFWRRWHISLSSWLKDYLYISLGGNRKGKIRTYINLLITMLLGGLWHGASVSFILWGVLHGVALAVHKFVMNHFSSFKPLGSEMKPWRRVIGVLVTFHLVCFGWILFRADSMQTVGEMLTQIFTNFHPEVFTQFVMGYKGVFVLMVVGYILHFLPKSAENSLQAVVTRSPLLVQAVMLAIAIFVVVQFKSAGVQPFIYFQF